MILPALDVSSPASDAPFRHLRVASIVDEFTRASLAPEVQLLDLDARWWPLELSRFRPDVVFVESAWRGRDGGWKGKIASYPNRARSRRLDAVRLAARVAGIPTVFWNKEDPVHYDRFIAAARGFDAVFTTAIECVPRYHAALSLPPRRVAALPFAVQPRLYFPPDAHQRSRGDDTVFAGSYGESHFPERRRQLEVLLDGALAAGKPLVIYDRTADVPDPDKVFPDRFRPYIQGARDYRALADIYRRARVGLNVNSVTDSATMFSRRVFEMLACGLPVVSTPARGIDELLPGAVTVVSTVDEARDAIASSLPSPDTTTLLANHSMATRLATVFSTLGLA